MELHRSTSMTWFSIWGPSVGSLRLGARRVTRYESVMTDSEDFRIETDVAVVESDPFDDTDDWSNYFSSCTTRLFVADVEVGTLTATLVRGDLIVNDRQDIYDVMDSMTQEVHELCCALIDFDTHDYSKDVLDVTEITLGSDILYLRHLLIDEPFRGCGFGLAMIQQMLRYIPSAMVVLEPFPLQHRKRDEHDTEPRPDFGALDKVPLKKATAKLVEHYGRLGFEKLGKTKYMIRSEDRVYDVIPAKATAAKRRAMVKAAAPRRSSKGNES